jgi:hypothetical protein
MSNTSMFSFSPVSIMINTVFGTAAGFNSSGLRADFGSGALSEAASQPINFVGAAVDDKTKGGN